VCNPEDEDLHDDEIDEDGVELPPADVDAVLEEEEAGPEEPPAHRRRVLLPLECSDGATMAAVVAEIIRRSAGGRESTDTLIAAIRESQRLGIRDQDRARHGLTKTTINVLLMMVKSNGS